MAGWVLARAAVAGRLKALRARAPAGPAVAVEVRRALERLGPAFVKLGQLASVRPDIFPPDLVFELEKLQEDVPPDPYEVVAGVVEQEFGRGPEALFASFDREPMAAGSVAQVHRAALEDGRAVVVKVQRPQARELMTMDLGIAARLARWAGLLRIIPAVDAVAAVDESKASAARELDFRVEAAHCDRFAFLFDGDPEIVIPRVIWGRTSGRVLTMERIEGWTLGQVGKARKAGVDAPRLARVGARAFMQQVLVFGFFHADLHPANIILTADGRLAYLDFGIVGRLDQRERRLVARLLASLTSQDPDTALDVSRGLGVRIPNDAAAAVRLELERLMDRFLSGSERLRMVQFGREFLSLLRRHRVRVPAGYALLVKALVTVEGVSQTLAPEINMVRTARPVASALALRQAMGETLAGRAVFSALRKCVGLSDTLRGAPRVGDGIVAGVVQGD